jgi:hypothetical protein
MLVGEHGAVFESRDPGVLEEVVRIVGVADQTASEAL